MAQAYQPRRLIFSAVYFYLVPFSAAVCRGYLELHEVKTPTGNDANVRL